MLIAIISILGNMILSALVGFLHGGVLGYFVGGLNIAGITIFLMALGFEFGKQTERKSIVSWAKKDDELTKGEPTACDIPDRNIAAKKDDLPNVVGRVKYSDIYKGYQHDPMANNIKQKEDA